MRKPLINLILVLAVLLAACSQATPGSPATAANSTAAVNPVAIASVTKAAKPASNSTPTKAVTQSPIATQDAKSPQMDCQVVSTSPTQGPTEASMFPPPTKDDWTLGQNPKAPMTLIEYSDFQ
jgi:hypothetical protein